MTRRDGTGEKRRLIFPVAPVTGLLDPIRLVDKLPSWNPLRRLRRGWFQRIAGAQLQALDYPGADATLARALIVFPRDADLLSTYALSANDRGLYAEALSRWEAARDADPGRALNWSGVAGNLRALGDVEAADTTIEEALVLFPDETCIHAEAARIAMARGSYQRAFDAWTQAIVRFPLPDWLLGQATALVKLKRYAEATVAFEALGAVEPAQAGLRDQVEELTRLKRQAEDHLAVPDTAPVGERDTAITPGDLFGRFESLGDNCEFGLVQRYTHIDPLGLFRFSWSTTDALIAVFSDGFATFGTDDDLELVINTTDGSYDGRSIAFPDIQYHTDVHPSDIEAGTLLRRERKKVAYLKTRMLQDLATADKIFVRKGGSYEGNVALFRILRRYGRNTLLWVDVADADHPPGSVERIEDGLLRGRISRFAPYGNAHDIDLRCWAALCCKALALKSDEVEGRRFVLAPNIIYRMGLDWAVSPLCAKSDVVQPLFPGLTTQRLTLLQDTRRDDAMVATRYLDHELAPRSHATFSVWVWIPADFAGTFLDVFVANTDTCFLHMADLGQRDRWQRVWTSARVPKDQTRLAVALRVTGMAEDTIFVGGWRLESGSIPDDWVLDEAPQRTA